MGQVAIEKGSTSGESVNATSGLTGAAGSPARAALVGATVVGRTTYTRPGSTPPGPSSSLPPRASPSFLGVSISSTNASGCGHENCGRKSCRGGAALPLLSAALLPALPGPASARSSVAPLLPLPPPPRRGGVLGGEAEAEEDPEGATRERGERDPRSGLRGRQPGLLERVALPPLRGGLGLPAGVEEGLPSWWLMVRGGLARVLAPLR